DENGSIHQIPSDPAHAREAILEFAPDVVLYRPVPKVQWLHAFAMETIDWLQRPLLTWFMDDWPADLNSSNDPEWQTLRLDLQRLLTKSSVCLSICEAMSKAYKQRYGKDFIAIANGVNPVEWPALRQHEKGKLLVRYAGGLSDNMCLDSVLRLARSVEILGQEGLDIRLEINTQKWWWKRSHTDFAGFTFTKIESKEHSIQEYRSWISEADISVIAYNFDMNSLRYVRYSMANKMPECLASGSVVLAHGPVEIATIQYLSKTDAAVIVTTPSEQALVDTLRELASDPAKRNQLARQGRDLAFQRHNMLSIREQLRSVIFSCCMARSGESRASQRMLVLRYSSEWLLDQEQTRLKLAADPILTANLAEAINGLSSDDALKQQYIAVTDFVARAEKRSKTPLGDRQLQELILGNFSSRNSNELIIENKTQTP
ncbi:MAG: glycosyltransferase, partial [Cyanobacteriota bacterium]